MEFQLNCLKDVERLLELLETIVQDENLKNKLLQNGSDGFDTLNLMKLASF